MRAVLIYRMDQEFDDGSRAVGVIWRVPSPVDPSMHEFKYRLVYLVGGRRVVGFDNERGKGDHRHVGSVETAYPFSTPEALLKDFWRDVAQWRQDHEHRND